MVGPGSLQQSNTISGTSKGALAHNYHGPHQQQAVTLSNSAAVFTNHSPQKILSGNNRSN